MSRAVVEAHRLLKAQYNLKAAARFMPHATLKGFFRSDARPETIMARLDAAMAGWQPFTVYNNGVGPFGPSSIVIGLRERADGSPNPHLYELQERAWIALEPLIHPDCEFSPRDPRGLSGSNPFHPHVTLAMGDLRPELQEEVLAFLQEGAPLGPGRFTATICHLYRFEADWSGAWWQTLTWEHIYSSRAG